MILEGEPLPDDHTFDVALLSDVLRRWSNEPPGKWRILMDRPTANAVAETYKPASDAQRGPYIHFIGISMLIGEVPRGMFRIVRREVLTDERMKGSHW